MSELLDISTQGVLGENKNILPFDSETDFEKCHIKFSKCRYTSAIKK